MKLLPPNGLNTMKSFDQSFVSSHAPYHKIERNAGEAIEAIEATNEKEGEELLDS
jgi:hypothetical protein